MYNRTDPRAIHETIVRDIVDVMSDIKNADELQFILGKNGSFKSIASASSNLTVVFPDLVSRSMDLSTAIMTVKAQERKCAAMMQMLFSAFHVTDAKDAIEYLSKFHTNLKLDGDINIDKFIGFMDKLSGQLTENCGIEVDNKLYDAVKEDMQNLGYYLPSDTKSNDLNSYKYSKLNGGRVIKETLRPTSTANSVKLDDPRQQAKNMAEYNNKQIIDADIKKANELMPTMMTVNFVTKQKNDEIGVQTMAIIGIKVKMYPVDSTDIIDRIKSKNRDGNGLNAFIRATTREISFWKDFLFAIEKAKLDALASSKRGSTSPIWKLLERRAIKSRMRRALKFTNDATAITSLTMTQYEVEYLKKTENIDMMDLKTARRMMEDFNLMSIVIVDETLECANFIYDTGDDMYETITFSSLERESSDNTYKRVVNLMTKMR